MRIQARIYYIESLGSFLTFYLIFPTFFSDSPWVIGSVGNNMKGRTMAWEFVKTHYPKIHDRYKSGSLLTRMCQFTTENFATNEMAHEVETFFKENFNPAERTIKQSVENIALNAKWFEKDGDKIRKFFS